MHILKLCLMIWSSLAFGLTVKFESTKLNSSQTEISGNLIISNIKTSEISGSNEESYSKQIDFFIDKETSPILQTDQPEKTDFNSKYFWKFSRINLEETSTGRHKMTCSFTIRLSSDNPGGTPFSKLAADNNGKIKLEGGFTPPDGDIVKSDVQEVEENISINQDAVSGFVGPSHEGLIITWENNSSHSKVIVLLVPPGLDNLPLKASELSTTDCPDNKKACFKPQDTCRFTRQNQSGTYDCLTGCESAFLNNEQDSTLSPKEIDTSYATVSYSNLETSEYTVILQFPNSTKRSCINATPIRTTSLTEANGGPAATKGDPRCFIATAAWGSSLHPHVDRFREFRDRFLSPYSWGKKVLNFYYENSQGLAKSIRANPALAYPTRLFLSFIILPHILYPGLGPEVLLIWLFVILIIPVFILRRKRA